ncbi:hypothetical protein M2129_001527 [Polynucleobacter sphagniphilus]|nr:hypothetical protein [Polynucleobacter sphagniphilus]
MQKQHFETLHSPECCFIGLKPRLGLVLGCEIVIIFYWFLLVFIGFYWFLLVFIGFYWFLLGRPLGKSKIN